MSKNIIIKRSYLSGEINIPSSKSYIIRALLISSLTEGISIIKYPDYCDDVNAFIGVLKQSGIKIKREFDKITIENSFFEIIRQENIFNKTNFNKINNKGNNNITLNCNESGLCARIVPFFAALIDKQLKVTGKGSLKKRQLFINKKILKKLGIKFNSKNGYLPYTVSNLNRDFNIFFDNEIKIKNKKSRVIFNIDCSKTSQFLTGLLIFSPLFNFNSEIIVKNLKSKPYIDLTIEMMKKAGINIVVKENENKKHYFIEGNQKYKNVVFVGEGDWSSASFLMVAGAVCGDITISNLNLNSMQGDKNIIDILKSCGVNISVGKYIDKDNNFYNKNYLNENGIKITVKKSDIKPFTYDASDTPDLFPPLVALASYCDGVSIIYGVNRLKNKESNRALCLKNEFAKLGIKIKVTKNKMVIYNNKYMENNYFKENYFQKKYFTIEDFKNKYFKKKHFSIKYLKNSKINNDAKVMDVDSHNDHRIAMALIVAAICMNKDRRDAIVRVKNIDCIAKSYPDFLNDLIKLGANIKDNY